jgi:hypothetical protein
VERGRIYESRGKKEKRRKGEEENGETNFTRYPGLHVVSNLDCVKGEEEHGSWKGRDSGLVSRLKRLVGPATGFFLAIGRVAKVPEERVPHRTELSPTISGFDTPQRPSAPLSALEPEASA